MKSLMGKRLSLLAGLLAAGLGFAVATQTANAAPHGGGGFHGGGLGGGSFHGGGYHGFYGGGAHASASQGWAYHGGGYHGYAYHPYYHGYPYYHRYPRYWGYPYYGGYSFGFGFDYSPSYYYPSYDYPYPDYYPAVVQEPAVAEQPYNGSQLDMAQQPSSEEATQAPAPPQQAPAFVETNRRFHRHGSNAGQLDWVEGLLDGHPVRIYYDDFGRVRKQKWLD